MWGIITTKRVGEGKRVPRSKWELSYWGLGTSAVSWWVYDRWLRPKQPSAEEIAVSAGSGACACGWCMHKQPPGSMPPVPWGRCSRVRCGCKRGGAAA